MSVLMQPTLFPMLFRHENVKLLRYLGRTRKQLELSNVIHTRSMVSNQCSEDNIPETYALIDLYSKSEALALMPGHFQNGCAFEVLRLFKSMTSDHDKSCPPNGYISGLVLSSCLNTGYLLLGRQCHGYFLKSGLVFNQYMKTGLVRLYSMLSDVVSAMEVLLCKPVLDTYSYNLILVGLVEKGYLDEALIILRRMLAEDMVWNKATYIGALDLCARLLDADLGRQVHSKLLQSDVEFDESVCSAMIHMYGKCKEIISARKVFDRFEPPRRTVVIWTAMLAAYLEHRSFEESLILFFEMQHEDVVPNESTFSVLLTVAAGLLSMRCGKSLQALAVKTGFGSHKNVEDTLIDMYSRTGDIKAAEKVFLAMTNYRDIITWNLMMSGYCHHGLGNESLGLFQEMLKLGELDPNYETFVGVLNACGHLGLVEEGFYYLYELMKQKGVQPGSEHYMCIINMLIKGGQLNEALSFIVSTPSKSDVFAWTALISGCRDARRNYNNNNTLGIRVAELIPDDMATKVSKWGGVTQVRELLMEETKDIKQEERGMCWVELEDETYEFLSVVKGDPKFDLSDQMMKWLLSCLKWYFDKREPDTDVGDLLTRVCDGYLSEELAVAFALWETHILAPICIIKSSGKISADCHSLMKLASRAFVRPIIVRDAHFFHNFQDGRCSCLDYW